MDWQFGRLPAIVLKEQCGYLSPSISLKRRHGYAANFWPNAQRSSSAEFLALGHVPNGRRLFQHARLSTFHRIRGDGPAYAVRDRVARAGHVIGRVSGL